MWVQVPSTWRAVIENSATLQLFLDFYRSTTPPLSSMALECLVRLSDQAHACHTACLMANAVTSVPECLVRWCDCPSQMPLWRPLHVSRTCPLPLRKHSLQSAQAGLQCSHQQLASAACAVLGML